MIVDAHLDLSMNALEWNRDLRWTIKEIRDSERGMFDKPDRGNGTVSFDALRKGNVGLIFATQIARFTKKNNTLPGASWNSPHQAWAQTQGQLAWYKTMELEGELNPITDLNSLNNHLKIWEKEMDKKPLGYVLTLEGADSILSFKHLENAYENGLRAIGPAHYGPGTYAQGTYAKGGIGQKGKALLKEMDQLKMILDVTHLSDDSFWEALEHFKGPVWASHNNCRALVPNLRQFSDEQLKVLIQRGAVIGTALDAWMLTPNWIKGTTTPKGMNVSLQNVVNHMDHICQLSGNSFHAGIGSDLDGAFGIEQAPFDVNSITDLQKIPEILSNRGYSENDIKNICGNNWIEFLRNAWDK